MKKFKNYLLILFLFIAMPLISQVDEQEQNRAFSDKLFYLFGGIMFALLIFWGYKVMKKKDKK